MRSDLTLEEFVWSAVGAFVLGAFLVVIGPVWLELVCEQLLLTSSSFSRHDNP